MRLRSLECRHSAVAQYRDASAVGSSAVAEQWIVGVAGGAPASAASSGGRSRNRMSASSRAPKKKGIETVPFERPRATEIIASGEFMRLKQRWLQLLHSDRRAETLAGLSPLG